MPNEMRDRLVELLLQKTCHYSDTPCDKECGVCGNIELYRSDVESIATHLIENGVIVPPCKVWDELYIPDYENKSIYETAVKKINISGMTKDKGFFHFDSLGKTIFLSREEAEQKLKEMRGETDA